MPIVKGAGLREDAAQCQKDEDGRDQPCQKVSFDALPDNVLLEISNFYLDLSQHDHPSFIVDGASLDPWRTLVHVCQRWRYTVFASPRYLNLRLHCTNRTPVGKMLDIWPAFPIVVTCHTSPHSQLRGVCNVIAALKSPDRVCEISLQGIPDSLLKNLAAINVPFPVLTSLQLSSEVDHHEGWVHLGKSFLGGTAPRLRSLDLRGVPFSAPLKLLSSTTDLVTLRLERISMLGYILPEDVVTFLSTLTKLEVLVLGFRASHYLYPPVQYLPPVRGTVLPHLPALTSFRFRGDCWYLEVLITRISFPVLDNLDITLFPKQTVNSPPLCEFISDIETRHMHDRADISFHYDFVNITLSRQEELADCRMIELGIVCSTLELQILYLMRLPHLSLPSLPTLEHLYIHGRSLFPEDDVEFSPEDIQWLELFHPFTSVKKLYLSEKSALHVSHALQGISGENVPGVLPALRDIFFPGHEPSGAILEAIGVFVATLQLSGRSVSVHY